jgi:hypothetical protein
MMFTRPNTLHLPTQSPLPRLPLGGVPGQEQGEVGFKGDVGEGEGVLAVALTGALKVVDAQRDPLVAVNRLAECAQGTPASVIDPFDAGLRAPRTEVDTQNG